MAIVCGTKKNRECNYDTCLKEFCEGYVEVYTGKDFEIAVLKNIANIYSEYSIRRIKGYCRKYNSLRYMMGLYGHDAQFRGDLDEIYYLAGTIVLLQQHVFRECTVWDKVDGYRLMKKLGITLDRKMKKDYRKAMKKYRASRCK